MELTYLGTAAAEGFPGIFVSEVCRKAAANGERMCAPGRRSS